MGSISNLVIVSTNVRLIQIGIEDDTVVVNVDFGCCFLEAFVNWHLNIMRNCLLAILLLLLGFASAGLLARGFSFCRHENELPATKIMLFS